MKKKIVSIVVLLVGISLLWSGEVLAEGGNFCSTEKAMPLYMQIIKNLVCFAEGTLNKWFGMPGFCWICPIFRVVFVGMNIMVNAITGALGTLLVRLAGIILLFIIAFKILKNFIQLGGFSGPDFFKELFSACFKTIVIIIFLKSMDALWYYFLEPILNLALGFANDLQTYAGSATSIESLNEYLQSHGLTEIDVSGSCEGIDCRVSGGILGNATCGNIMRMLCKFSSAVVAGMSMGILLVGSSLSLQDNNINIVLFFVGVFVLISYGTVIVKVPLMYVEAIFKMGFVLALSPILLLLWLMPSTTGYTINALKNFLGSCLQIVFLALMTAVAMVMLNYSLGAGTENEFIKAMLEGREISEILKQLTAGCFVVLWAWISCALATRFFEMAVSFADFFAQTQSPRSGVVGTVTQWVGKLGSEFLQGINEK